MAKLPGELVFHSFKFFGLSSVTTTSFIVQIIRFHHGFHLSLLPYDTCPNIKWGRTYTSWRGLGTSNRLDILVHVSKWLASAPSTRRSLRSPAQLLPPADD